MARVFLTPIDLQGNELQNARLQNLAVAPANPTTGAVYYNSAEKRGLIWDGTDWVPLKVTISGTGLVLDDGDLSIDPTKLDLSGNQAIKDLQDALTKLDLSKVAGAGLVWDADTGTLALDTDWLTDNVVTLDGLQTVTGVKTFDTDATPLIDEAIDPDTEPVDSKKAVNVAYVQAVVNALIDGAPGTLDTLNEIATALQADETAQDAIVARLTDLEAKGTSKFSATLGDGVALTYPVVHNLKTTDVTVQIYDTTGAQVDTDVAVTDTNTVTVTFAVAPGAGAYRVVVVG